MALAMARLVGASGRVLATEIDGEELAALADADRPDEARERMAALAASQEEESPEPPEPLVWWRASALATRVAPELAPDFLTRGDAELDRRSGRFNDFSARDAYVAALKAERERLTEF